MIKTTSIQGQDIYTRICTYILGENYGRLEIVKIYIIAQTEREII